MISVNFSVFKIPCFIIFLLYKLARKYSKNWNTWCMRPWPPLGKSENIFWRDTLLKMGLQTYIFCSKVSSKCKKCRFRDPNFKQIPGGMPRTPLQLCRHYCVLTKILATPLQLFVHDTILAYDSMVRVLQNFIYTLVFIYVIF